MKKILIFVLIITIAIVLLPFITKAEEPTEPVKESYDLPNFLGVDDPNLFVGRLIKVAIGFVGTIALIVFIYGGVMWLISTGKEEYITKGKNAMIWSAIGLAVVFASYIIVKYVFDLLVE